MTNDICLLDKENPEESFKVPQRCQISSKNSVKIQNLIFKTLQVHSKMERIAQRSWKMLQESFKNLSKMSNFIKKDSVEIQNLILKNIQTHSKIERIPQRCWKILQEPLKSVKFHKNSGEIPNLIILKNLQIYSKIERVHHKSWKIYLSSEILTGWLCISCYVIFLRFIDWKIARANKVAVNWLNTTHATFLSNVFFAAAAQKKVSFLLFIQFRSYYCFYFIFILILKGHRINTTEDVAGPQQRTSQHPRV